MNCHETYLWMLEAEEPTASPPGTVADHLRDCAKCRRRQQRVQSLLTTVQSLPPPPEDPQVRAEVIELVHKTPVGPAELPPPTIQLSQRLRRWGWVPAGMGFATAAALLIGLFGGLAYYFFPQPTNNAVSPGPVAASRDGTKRHWNEGDLRSHLLEHTLNLADAKAPLEQFYALTDIAADLESECVAQAGLVDKRDLQRLAALHDQVLEEGVVPQMSRLSPAERQQALPLTLAELRKSEKKTQEAAARKQVAAEPLLRCSVADHKAADSLERPAVAQPPKHPKAVANAPLVETFVASALSLAGENDPLRRAEVFTDVADSLIHTLQETTQHGGDENEVKKLNLDLQVVMSRAVRHNLDRFNVQAADPARRADFERVNKPRQRFGTRHSQALICATREEYQPQMNTDKHRF